MPDLTVTKDLSPKSKASPEHLAEVAQLLAAGILRMAEKSSSISAPDGDSSLAIPQLKSVSRTGAKARVGER